MRVCKESTQFIYSIIKSINLIILSTIESSSIEPFASNITFFLKFSTMNLSSSFKKAYLKSIFLLVFFKNFTTISRLYNTYFNIIIHNSYQWGSHNQYLNIRINIINQHFLILKVTSTSIHQIK